VQAPWVDIARWPAARGPSRSASRSIVHGASTCRHRSRSAIRRSALQSPGRLGVERSCEMCRTASSGAFQVRRPRCDRRGTGPAGPVSQRGGRTLWSAQSKPRPRPQAAAKAASGGGSAGAGRGRHGQHRQSEAAAAWSGPGPPSGRSSIPCLRRGTGQRAAGDRCMMSSGSKRTLSLHGCASRSRKALGYIREHRRGGVIGAGAACHPPLNSLLGGGQAARPAARRRVTCLARGPKWLPVACRELD
jgi:hypothetical protein